MLNLTINHCKIPNVMKMVENVCLLHDKYEMYADEAFQSKQDNLGKLSNGFPLSVKRFNYRNIRGKFFPSLNLKRLSYMYDKVLNSSHKVFDSDLEWSHRTNTANLIATKE